MENDCQSLIEVYNRWSRLSNQMINGKLSSSDKTLSSNLRVSAIFQEISKRKQYQDISSGIITVYTKEKNPTAIYRKK